MANKYQKPVSQLQNPRGGRAERRMLTVVTDNAPLEVPPMPKGLRASGKRQWEAYWGDRVSLAATGVDAYDIERYCRLLDERDTLKRAALRKPVVQHIYGETPNPRWRIVKELTREIEKTRDMLGILPLSRMRLGLVTVQTESGKHDLKQKLRQTPADEPAGFIDLDALG